MIFYNKVPFREVGLDPEHAPATLEEVQAASEKLLKKDSAGNVTRSGIVLEINDWYVWQIHALQGELAIDNGNGREGRPTEAIFNGPTGQRLFTWWNDMIEQGLAYNVGRNPNGIDNFMAVASGRAAMTLTASSALRSVVDVLEKGMEGVELGTGLFPGFADGKGGPQMAGLFLWILNTGPRRSRKPPGSWSNGSWSPSSRPNGSLAAATCRSASPPMTCRRRSRSWSSTPCSASPSRRTGRRPRHWPPRAPHRPHGPGERGHQTRRRGDGAERQGPHRGPERGRRYSHERHPGLREARQPVGDRSASV